MKLGMFKAADGVSTFWNVTGKHIGAPPWVGKGMDLKTENVFKKKKKEQKLQVPITIECKEYFMSTTSA